MNPHLKAAGNIVGWIILIPATLVYFGCVGLSAVLDKRSERMHQ